MVELELIQKLEDLLPPKIQGLVVPFELTGTFFQGFWWFVNNWLLKFRKSSQSYVQPDMVDKNVLFPLQERTEHTFCKKFHYFMSIQNLWRLNSMAQVLDRFKAYIFDTFPLLFFIHLFVFYKYLPWRSFTRRAQYFGLLGFFLISNQVVLLLLFLHKHNVFGAIISTLERCNKPLSPPEYLILSDLPDKGCLWTLS